MKQVAYKLEMHCQHYRKDLSKKQAEMAAIVQSKKGKKEFTLGVRNKKNTMLFSIVSGWPDTFKTTALQSNLFTYSHGSS